ncbi:dsDNA-binding protein [Aeromonas phage AS-zj]|uniref:DsDNA-binding protein n=2 Tax=Caudoviricetes TaxID=2731619 RepID=A0A223LDS0_9CAUD|nr:transcriptional regulator [Aeromonas phage AS-zj]ASU00138.1 dsDNA-binding protein [Aeromonas phage AS-zj]QMV28794.1 double-stranded DNA-binding protein [Aeromonas phage AP1]UKM62526.1 putative double-stranded DNA binding protein [Aeromonas phage P19]
MAREAKEKPIFNIHSSKQELIQLVKTCYEHHTKISIEKEGIKAAKDAAKAMGVDGKRFNKVLKMYLDQNRDEVEQENEEAIDLFDTLFVNGMKQQTHDFDDEVGEDE